MERTGERSGGGDPFVKTTYNNTIVKAVRDTDEMKQCLDQFDHFELYDVLKKYEGVISFGHPYGIPQTDRGSYGHPDRFYIWKKYIFVIGSDQSGDLPQGLTGDTLHNTATYAVAYDFLMPEERDAIAPYCECPVCQSGWFAGFLSSQCPDCSGCIKSSDPKKEYIDRARRAAARARMTWSDVVYEVFSKTACGVDHY